MAQNSHLYRRISGIYVVRLVVPERLRGAIGKRELHMSTGSRTPAIAKAIGSALLAHWRERFIQLDQTMNFEQIALGSPMLLGTGYLRLSDAAKESGLDEHRLLSEAANGTMGLFVRVVNVSGFLVPAEQLEVEQPEGITVVPISTGMPPEALQHAFTGLLRVRGSEEIATALMASTAVVSLLFDVPDRPKTAFAPDEPQKITRTAIEVEASSIERLRLLFKSNMTPDQLAFAKERPVVSPLPAKSQKRASEALELFMEAYGKTVAPDQARRARAACSHFISAEGDPEIGAVDRDRLSDYIGKLQLLPADQHIARIKHSGNIPEDWPRITLGEIQKRLRFISSMFAWMTDRTWITVDPAVNLASEVNVKSKNIRAQDMREPFTDEELKKIFSMEWYKTGAGKLNRANNYKGFQPHYYWLPLLALFTGARLAELCQLHLADIQVTANNVWFISINENGPDKRLKNPNAIRNIPIHPLVIRMGFIPWRNALIDGGFTRLFPELKYGVDKGYSRGPTRWFNNGLLWGKFRWPRDGKKVFHSFRHTFITHCRRKLHVEEAILNQITGHERGNTTSGKTYASDSSPDDLVLIINKVVFNLPEIATFNIEEGLRATKDSFDRKR